eukprot:m.18673 g.18673  ORF g.18673 m.18673 type:complete len:320 (-) comp4994_c0_seq1:631-1590(-)
MMVHQSSMKSYTHTHTHNIADLQVLEVENVGSQQFDSIDVVRDIKLLILRVRTIIAASHWKQHDILLSGLLEDEGDWNGTSLTCHVWGDTVDLLSGFNTSYKVWMVSFCNPRHSTVLTPQLKLCLCTKRGMHLLAVLLHFCENVIWILVWHKSDAELSNHLAGNDSLCTFGVERTLNAMDGERRIAPAMHQCSLFCFMNSSMKTIFLNVIFIAKSNWLVQFHFILCHSSNGLVYSWNEDFAMLIDQAVKHFHQINHGFVRGSPKHPRVKILCCARNLSKKVTDTTETICNAWFLGSQPIVITNAHAISISKEIIFFCHD